MALLQQLLYSESLSLSWRDISCTVVRQVSRPVGPRSQLRDDMDIRSCPQQDISGAGKFDSAVVPALYAPRTLPTEDEPLHQETPILLLKCFHRVSYRSRHGVILPASTPWCYGTRSF
ncbi:hypothetical protein FQN60_018544 [Etheostoma spectabile]|uniref:Uncharacterized protein n=1 Tax=Etheostoma spectabile TaxID=54343 RepID=A0A5J5DIN4_9PERO|nr:hypothetical protein FQN60_018544 [Etheostoma spectabile]